AAEALQLPERLEELARPTARCIEQAKVLHPAFYTDQSYAQLERERIFGMNWFAAAHVQELSKPGDVKVVEVGTKSIILTRDKNHKLHAFYNTCRHRGARVCSTSASGCKQLVCPYHWWAYRLDGSLKSTPPAAVPKERKEELGLLRVPGLETFAGIIFLNQTPNPMPLRDSLGDLTTKLQRYDLDDMEMHAQKTYDIAGDWKLICENFVDFYHIDAVHPALSRFSRVDDHLPYQGGGQYVGFVTSPLTDCGGPGDSDRFNSFGRLRPIESNSALFFHIFPNVSVTVYPHSVYTLLTLPSKTPGKTEEQLSLLMAPGARRKEVSQDEHTERCNALMDFVTNINDEDVVAIENLQVGLSNLDSQGMHGEFLPKYDWPVHRFQNMVLSGLRGSRLEEDFMPKLTDSFERKATECACWMIFYVAGGLDSGCMFCFDFEFEQAWQGAALRKLTFQNVADSLSAKLGFVQANATISQAELERKEVEREEFSSEGEGVAYTLLSAVTFVGVTLYVVSWPGDGVRYYGWIVIGTAMSILASLLFFHKTARSLESLVFPSEASVGFRCAFYYGLFLVFFVAMQLAVGFSAGLLCADVDHEDVEFEDWVIDDPVTASHKDIVDPACIVYKRWGRAIGTDEDRHPIFLRHRNLTLEKIELRLKTIAAFLSHVTAFAAIRAGVMLQHFPFFRQNALCSLLSVLVHVAFLFLIFRVLEMVRCGGKPEKLVDLYFDEVDDVEVDVLSLSCSYMLVLCLGYAVTGEPSDFEGFQLPSTVDLKKAVIIFILGGLLFAASVALVFFWRPRYSEQSWRAKVRDMVLCTLAMAFGWCIIHAVRWTNTDLSKNRVIGFLPGSMILHVITAFVMSLLGYIVVLFLDKLEDLCLTRFGSLGRSFKSAVTATGLIIGVSWETCFDKAVSIVAHGQREKQVVEPLLVVVLLLLLVPAWKRFVITKQLHFESFKFERRSQSYLKKDNDTLLPQSSKEVRAGCMG
ncbi:yeaW, partial [Symbiodinium sp. KB8]